jgi:hypothetical protein
VACKEAKVVDQLETIKAVGLERGEEADDDEQDDIDASKEKMRMQMTSGCQAPGGTMRVLQRTSERRLVEPVAKG